MSIDKTLKGKNTLARHRNVLTRAERIEYLQEAGLWKEDSTPTGLPKVGHRKVSVGKKDKAKKTEEDADSDSTAGADATTDKTDKK